MAVAIQGWASWSSNARPAPRNIAASLSIRHIIELGPNAPAQLPAAASRTIASSRSRSASPTTENRPREVPIASPAIRYPNVATLVLMLLYRRPCDAKGDLLLLVRAAVGVGLPRTVEGRQEDFLGM